MSFEEIMALLRRYAEAFATGRIEARSVKRMTDEELAAFDDELSARLAAKQEEAERLAREEE